MLKATVLTLSLVLSEGFKF